MKISCRIKENYLILSFILSKIKLTLVLNAKIVGYIRSEYFRKNFNVEFNRLKKKVEIDTPQPLNKLSSFLSIQMDFSLKKTQNSS